jgi:ribulose-phosphate 3-epimerase
MDIIPGIFEKDQKEVERKISIVSPFAQWIQIDMSHDSLDVADTLTFFSFLKRQTNNFFEAHLMAPKPETYVKYLMQAGFKRIIASVECQDPREFLSEARVYECEIGLSIDMETPLEEAEPFLEELDFMLVMTAGAGAGGQLFEESTLSKIKTIRRNLPDLPIEAEGGMNPESVKLASQAGATRIVSTSYIFQDEKRVGEAIERLKSAGIS